MSEDMFATPPISGENVPYKDLPEETLPVDQTKIKNKSDLSAADKKIKSMKYLMFGMGGIIFIIFIILLLILFKISQGTTSNGDVKATPTPVVTAQPLGSNLPAEIIDQVNQANTELKELDLQELDLSYPQVDWKVKY